MTYLAAVRSAGCSVAAGNRPMTHRHSMIVHPRRVDFPGSSWLNSRGLSQSLGKRLPGDLADLLEVAVGAYSADRKSRREFRGSQTGHRSIDLELALRSPDRWNSSRAATTLREYLNWLSGDDWSICFRQRCSQPSEAESQAPLLSPPFGPQSVVSLYSGGVDSLAGMASSILSNPGASHVLVSGYTHTRLLDQQRRQVRLIRSALDRRQRGAGSSITHVAVGFGLNRPTSRAEERSQRTRAFVFAAIGIAAAVLAETGDLHVFENGTGALNLPLTEAQLGVDNYRGVHPRSLILLERLLPFVIDRPVSIEHPHLLQTKAEMCQALSPAGLLTALPETVSCDRFPLRIRGQPAQCGYCTSCVLRRQALAAAGLSSFDPPSAYWHDIREGYADPSDGRRFGVLVMRHQVDRIARDLGQADPWSALTTSFPELSRTAQDFAVRHRVTAERGREGLLRLLRKYVAEWRDFPTCRP